MRSSITLGLLTALTILLFCAAIYFGSIYIPAADITSILLGNSVNEHPSWSFVILESRLPSAIAALFCGASLASAGLMLQTAFRNPLAGPSILGIDSGANLGVALVMLLSGGVLSSGAISLGGFALVIIAALFGAMAILLLLLFLNAMLRNNVMLLIAGIMISYITSSVISLLNYQATEEGVRSFVMWGMGSFNGVSLDRLPYFAGACLLGLLMATLLIKPLNALLLGDNYARNLGINIRTTHTVLLITTGILTASCTAFCGPISFIGLAVPHIARMLLGSSNHRALMPATMLCGASLALLCSIASVLFTENSVLPINVLTPIVGAPVVLYIILRRYKN